MSGAFQRLPGLRFVAGERIREIYSNEWKQRKLEDPVHYKGLKKDYVGDVSALVLACGDARTKQVYLTTRQAGGARRGRAGIKKVVSSANRAAPSVGGADRARAQLAKGKAAAQPGRIHALGDL